MSSVMLNMNTTHSPHHGLPTNESREVVPPEVLSWGEIMDEEVACLVQDSWDMVACTGGRNWIEKTADIFLESLLDILPQGVASSSKLQKEGAKAFVLAVDRTVSACGGGEDDIANAEDPASLQQELFRLGRNQRRDLNIVLGRTVSDDSLEHSSNSDWSGFLAKALLQTLQQILTPENFHKPERKAWKIVLDYMTYWMTEGYMSAAAAAFSSSSSSSPKEEDELLFPDLEKQDNARGQRRSSNSSSTTTTTRSCSVTSASAGRRRSSISTRMSINMGSATRRSSLLGGGGGDDSSSLSYADCCDEDTTTTCTNLYEPLSALDVDFTTVELVVDSWQALARKNNKNNPDWQTECGTSILIRLFQLVPAIKTAWGLPSDFDPSDTAKNTKANKKYTDRFQHRAKGFMVGIDKAVGLLETCGPDLEPLQQELQDLGTIHYYHMSAQPHYWPPTGIALMETLQEVSSSSSTRNHHFNEETKQAWGLIYHFLSYWMIEGVLAAKQQEKRRSL